MRGLLDASFFAHFAPLAEELQRPGDSFEPDNSDSAIPEKEWETRALLAEPSTRPISLPECAQTSSAGEALRSDHSEQDAHPLFRG